MTHKKLQHGGPRKAVPPEVKAEAVRRALAGDDLKAIAADLGISVPSVSKWRVAAGGTKFETHHPTSEQIAATILDRLRAACDRLRAACAMHPDTADAVRELADELDAQGGAALDALAAPEPEQPGEMEV